MAGCSVSSYVYLLRDLIREYTKHIFNFLSIETLVIAATLILLADAIRCVGLYDLFWVNYTFTL